MVQRIYVYKEDSDIPEAVIVRDKENRLAGVKSKDKSFEYMLNNIFNVIKEIPFFFCEGGKVYESSVGIYDDMFFEALKQVLYPTYRTSEPQNVDAKFEDLL